MTSTANDTPIPSLAPGPAGRPFVGNLPEMAPPATRLGTVLGWFRQYGEIVRISLGRRTMNLIIDPDALKRVLVDHAKNYPKSPEYDALRAFLGNGLFTSEGESWLHNRRMMQPYFHQKYIHGLVAPMVKASQDLVESWGEVAASGSVIDVARDMMALTLRIVGQTLLSTEMSHDAGSVGAALAEALELTNRRLFSAVPMPSWLPTSDNRRFRRAKAILDGVVFGVIKERREAPIASEGKPDLLAMLLAARDEETGLGMNDSQLRDEVMTIFLAGHETTATLMAWIWYLLSSHPAIERKLHEELDQVLGGRAPGVEDLAKLTYTTMVIEEALRIYPPVAVIQRIALADDVLGGFRVRAGDRVTANIYALHHNKRLWRNPEGFDPERFSPEQVGARHKFAYLPFGGGGRICIGNGFALMEAKVMLAVIAQKYSLELVPGRPVVPRPMVTLRPYPGVFVTLRPR